MSELTPFKDELPIPDVVRAARDGGRAHQLAICARSCRTSFHHNLPACDAWCYCLEHGEILRHGDGKSYLGPTIEVNSNETVSVDWMNKIAADVLLPFDVVKVPYTNGDDPIPENIPGSNKALSETDDPMRKALHRLRATLVTHVHGARVQSDSDGWPDNTAISGQYSRYIYQNDQPATMLWYHDHAMHVTRLNVFAGLAGAWLIRDSVEAALNLPHGRHELPLIIQDRNLALDDGGNFTGAPLHKTETLDGPAEFFGPYTLVNGRIWPKATVQARIYRLRLLNGSNARTYRLLFLDDEGNTIGNTAVRQIGCDQGLMNRVPVVPDDGWRLAPAERIDLLIDFSPFQDKCIFLWNTAEAPFGDSTDAGIKPSPADVKAELQAVKNGTPLPPAKTDDARRPFPQVMRFDVGTDAVEGGTLPAVGTPLLTPPRQGPQITADTPVRIALLVERPVPDPPPGNPPKPDAVSMLVFWECVRATAPSPPTTFSIKYWHPGKCQFITEDFQKAAEGFYDTLNWRVHLGADELWYFINLSEDTHPVHVHLVDMFVSQRFGFDLSKIMPDPGSQTLDPNKETLVSIESHDTPVPIEPIEIGPKDTARVNPGEMVGLAMTFAPYPGRYVYHCHILEHEDHDMMRPFVVVPPWVPHHND